MTGKGWIREPIATLDGRAFDVVVVGAGVNGAGAAKTLTAEGYSVLIVDKGDFASGSSGRSSGLLHCGLRYLEPNPTFWNFVKRPDKLAVALRMARDAMRDRDDFVTARPDNVVPYTSHFPIYKDSHFKTWQLDAALRILDVLGGGTETPLERGWVPLSEVRAHPLLRHLRDPDRLAGVARFREYRFDWPERITMDLVLDARHGGAEARNHCAVTGMARDGDGWRCALTDGPTGETATVRAACVLNTAGIWIDDVNAGAPSKGRRYITGTKGAHIVMRMPPELAGQGIVSLNSLKEPIYGVPWRGLYYFGPTETHYSGDKDAIHVTEEEIDFLLQEVDRLLPGLGVTRADIVFTWAGVRPLGYDPGYPEGKRSRDIHDLGADGLPNVFAMTAGPVMTHRSAGRAFLEVVAPRVAPSGPAREVERRDRGFAENTNARPLEDIEGGPRLTEAHVEACAREEGALTLTDLLVRRLGLVWTAGQGSAAAARVAALAAPALEWDDARVDAEIEAYRSYLAHIHRVPNGTQERPE
jgi:glycerol-3-phosphate dehydrogenase